MAATDMQSENRWHVIANEKASKVILGVDFPAEGRREASFKDLMGKMGPAWSGYKLIQTVPPSARLDERLSCDTYIQHWTPDGQWDPGDVAAVMGYCIGSVYAAPVAETVRRLGGSAVKVILFDPQPMETKLLATEMYKNITLAGSTLSDEEAASARKETDEIVAAHLNDLPKGAMAIMDLFRRISSLACGRIGLNDARREEINQIFESYMAWLSAAAQINPGAVWKDSVAIMSTDYQTLAAEKNTAIISTMEIIDQKFQVDVAHADLMRAEPTAALLLRHSGL